MASPSRWRGNHVRDGDLRGNGFGVTFHDTGDGFPARLIGTLVLLYGACCYVSVSDAEPHFVCSLHSGCIQTIFGVGPLETARLGLWFVLVSWYGIFVLRRKRIEREKRRIADEQESSRARGQLQARAQATLRIDRSEPARELAAEQV